MTNRVFSFAVIAAFFAQMGSGQQAVPEPRTLRLGFTAVEVGPVASNNFATLDLRVRLHTNAWVNVGRLTGWDGFEQVEIGWNGLNQTHADRPRDYYGYNVLVAGRPGDFFHFATGMITTIDGGTVIRYGLRNTSLLSYPGRWAGERHPSWGYLDLLGGQDAHITLLFGQQVTRTGAIEVFSTNDLARDRLGRTYYLEIEWVERVAPHFSMFVRAERFGGFYGKAYSGYNMGLRITK